jgi:hypothetical protein
MFKPLVNGVSYSWSTIRILIDGVPTIGVSSITYSEEREIEPVYGIGHNKTARAFGNVNTEGSITLHENELNALAQAVPTRKLYDIDEFDIIVSFLPQGGVPVTHTLKNCRFKNNGVDISQNDTAVETTVDLAIGEIDFGV